MGNIIGLIKFRTIIGNPQLIDEHFSNYPKKTKYHWQVIDCFELPQESWIKIKGKPNFWKLPKIHCVKIQEEIQKYESIQKENCFSSKCLLNVPFQSLTINNNNNNTANCTKDTDNLKSIHSIRNIYLDIIILFTTLGKNIFNISQYNNSKQLVLQWLISCYGNSLIVKEGWDWCLKLIESNETNKTLFEKFQCFLLQNINNNNFNQSSLPPNFVRIFKLKEKPLK